jgi:1,4-alpha-glucan branching enzyme
MRRFLLLFLLSPFALWAQTVTTNPAVPSPDQPVTITVNVAGTSLSGYAWNNDTAPVWLWAWLEKGTTDINAPTNVNPATAAQDAAKCTRIGTNPDIYQITITPTTFFNKPAAEITQIGLKLKTRNWSDNKQTDNDRFINLSLNFAITLSSPTTTSFFVENGEDINITTNTNQNSTITYKIDGASIATSAAGVNTFTYQHTVTETQGSVEVVCEANNGTETISTSFVYTLRSATINEARPSNIIDGINYETDPTVATLSLWAPGKSSVYVLGDFNDWSIDAAYQMKKDGEHFWLRLTGLTASQEYAFQYFVDETIKVADPYADKILDPEDQYIPETTYPNLKEYPSKALSNKWYENRVSVLQTAQQPYQWVVTDFQKPAKEKLVVYELLIRDFFDADNRNYQNLIDTISYLKRLGINAIELMPIMEFNGNEGWGYNPTFMFAPDKYYGTKNKLKEFVDRCHQEGIAVILDIALNHQDVPNTYASMYFNFDTFKPTPDNPWFNVDARHPFNVFNDMNHESAYTKKYIDTVNYYWLNEYKVDGFRFDLSKGFTQTNNPSNVGAWSSYDASRIALLKRMADVIWSHTPDAYVVLEHLGENTEEKELAQYRYAEGKGMMLWAKMTDQYNQNTMGYLENSSIRNVYHGERGWNAAHLVGYMESHDEERLMYKNLNFGTSISSYSTKDLGTALKRIAAANALFLTVPGPKMIWQFGEFGYDKSINLCENGTITENCRLSPKPTMWDFEETEGRRVLFEKTADMLRLRNTYDVFTNGEATFSTTNSLVKFVVLKNSPYNSAPTTAENMNAVVVSNFDLIERASLVDFPHTGTWYEYTAGGASVQVTQASLSVTLAPGEYKLYTDVAIDVNVITALEEDQNNFITVYPNPTEGKLILPDAVDFKSVSIKTLTGTDIQIRKIAENEIEFESHPGLYILRYTLKNKSVTHKIMKY